jgi:hypothetical protein
MPGAGEDGPWTQAGFQRADDPASDFRATGLLGLAAMVSVAEAADVAALAEAGAGGPPFALTSINVTGRLAALLEVDAPVHDAPVLARLMEVVAGLGRIVAVCCRSSSLHHIHYTL